MMRNTTKPPPDRTKRLQALRSRLPLIAGLTSPIWLVALLLPGSLGDRLLGAGLMLLLTLLVFLGGFLSLRWLIGGAGFLVALNQRREEKQKGELDDAKDY